MQTQRPKYPNPGNRGNFQGEKKPQRDFVGDFGIEWITNGLNEKCIDYSKDFGSFLADNRLTTSQIRNVYGELKRIQQKGFEKERTSFLLLRPKMAYADKRNENDGLRMLKRVFDKAAIEVKTEVHYNNLVNAMEAILAYHKAFGGK